MERFPRPRILRLAHDLDYVITQWRDEYDTRLKGQEGPHLSTAQLLTIAERRRILELAADQLDDLVVKLMALP